MIPRGPQLSTIESVEDERLSGQESLDIPSSSPVHRVPSRESSTDDEQAVPTDDEDHEVERSVNEKYNLKPEVDKDIQPSSHQTKVISRSSSSSSTTSVTELCDDDDKNFSCPEVEEVKDIETSVIPQIIDVDMEQDVQPEEHDEKFTDTTEEFGILETSRKSIIFYEDDKELEERIAQNVKKEMSELSIEDALERLRQKISSLSSEFDDEGR